MRRFFIGVIILLLILGCFIVIGCGDKQQPITKTTGNATSKKPATSEGTHSTVEGSIGEPVKLGDIEVKLVSWKFATPDDYDKPYERPNNKLIVTDVEVTNNGPTPFACDGTNNMRIRTPDGYEYELWDYALPDPQFPYTDMDQGEKCRGFVTFEVPKDIGSMVFQFDHYEKGRAKIKLQ